MAALPTVILGFLGGLWLAQSSRPIYQRPQHICIFTDRFIPICPAWSALPDKWINATSVVWINRHTAHFIQRLSGIFVRSVLRTRSLMAIVSMVPRGSGPQLRSA